MAPSLYVVMYHYVRDLPNTRFPNIKGMLTEDFRSQVALLQQHYEMATLESALDFLQGSYTPSRDLCLLTFDDGLKEHYTEVFPFLRQRDIQGLFFVITSCLESNCVIPVHLNHFLMAALDFQEYRAVFLDRLAKLNRGSRVATDVDPGVAQRTYRWDTLEVATFKYLFNFVLDRRFCDQILRQVFEEKLGDTETFSKELYLNSQEAREMQRAGMIIGGHSHTHRPLSSLSNQELAAEIAACQQILSDGLDQQPIWPFCYPYGMSNSFNDQTVRRLKKFHFSCSFSTEVGANLPGQKLFALRRFDCKDIPIR